MSKERFWEIILNSDQDLIMTFRPILPFIADEVRFFLEAPEPHICLSGAGVRLSLPVDPDIVPDLKGVSQVRLMEFDSDREKCKRDLLLDLS